MRPGVNGFGRYGCKPWRYWCWSVIVQCRYLIVSFTPTITTSVILPQTTNRSMVISKAEVDSWKRDALKNLEWAKELSSLAQAVLESTSHILVDLLPKRLQAAEIKVDQVKDLHANVNALVEHLRVKISDATIGGYGSYLKKHLDPALEALDHVLQELATTKVPEFLIAPGHKNEFGHLLDFVALNEIKLLQSNIAIYRGNCEKVLDLLKHQLHQLTHKAHKNASSFNKVMNIYNSEVVDLQLTMRHSHAYASVSPPRNHSNLVGVVLKENAALEQQLAGLLEMLTNHYSQCVLASSVFDEASRTQVNYEVLKTDTLELPSVLKEFSAIYDVIMNNEARAAKFVDSKLPHLDEVVESCGTLIEEYRELKETDIVKLVLSLLRCEEVLRSNSVGVDSLSYKQTIDTYTDILNQLTYHYTNFQKIYHSEYLTELHYEQFVYPRKFLLLLNDFLNGQLLQIEETEKERRSVWLSKFGNFIPKQFVLPGEYNQPSVVQVISEGLDEIQAPTAQEDEERLIALIGSLRPTKPRN